MKEKAVTSGNSNITFLQIFMHQGKLLSDCTKKADLKLEKQQKVFLTFYNVTYFILSSFLLMLFLAQFLGSFLLFCCHMSRLLKIFCKSHICSSRGKASDLERAARRIKTLTFLFLCCHISLQKLFCI